MINMGSKLEMTFLKAQRDLIFEKQVNTGKPLQKRGGGRGKRDL